MVSHPHAGHAADAAAAHQPTTDTASAAHAAAATAAHQPATDAAAAHQSTADGASAAHQSTTNGASAAYQSTTNGAATPAAYRSAAASAAANCSASGADAPAAARHATGARPAALIVSIFAVWRRTSLKPRPTLSIVPALLLFTLLAVLLSGCGSPLVAAAPVSAVALQGTLRATYVLAPPDATATPTPFQPLPPTPLPGQATPEPGVPLAPSFTPTASPTPQITLPAGGLPAEQALEALPSQINILLLGADRRPWDRQFRTDTIILLTLNSDLGQVNITSFPRDLYITIPGYGMDRINTAWTHGGYKLLAQTFKHNFGITPDYYVLIEFSSFKKIIDNLGGLDVNVAEAVSDYRAGYWVTIPKGKVHMDADTVLWYVRTRKTTNDIARNRRQQEVLQAIFDKLVSMDALRRAPEFYNLYKDSVKTDITLVDALKWLPFAAKIAETRNIRQFALTYNHVYDYITPGGAMVLVPNQEQMMKIIRKSQNLR